MADAYTGTQEFHGGPRDGETVRCIPPGNCAPPKNWPFTLAGIKRRGGRHWYDLDLTKSTNERAIYRYAGWRPDTSEEPTR